MLTIKTNLFLKEDSYIREYPVTIYCGNLIPEAPKYLPNCQDTMVNFKYQYSPIYAYESKNKVNTRFAYPYGGGYKKADKEGTFKAYAYLTWYQRIILSFITKTTIFHKHPIPSILITLNILGLIPVWVPFVCNHTQTNNQDKMKQNKQEILNNTKDTGSRQYQPFDSLKVK